MLVRRKREIVRLAAKGKTSYISAIVLGLNDAIIELTGALAGFTMALPNNRIIAMAGFTTGVAATLSMAASEFLSQEADENQRHPYAAAFYTGVTYLVTVAILLLPYFLFENPFVSLAVCLLFAALVILGFTWFVSRIRRTSFLRDFLRMLSISFSVAGIAFFIGWLAKVYWGVNI